MITTVVEEVCNRRSLSLRVTGDISLTVSNGYRNRLVSRSHPGVHVFEPSTTLSSSTPPPSAFAVLV